MGINDVGSLFTTPSPTDVNSYLLQNTMMQISQQQDAINQQDKAKQVARINASQDAGNYANTDQSGRTVTSGQKIQASLDANGRVSITNVGTGPINQTNAIIGSQQPSNILSMTTVDQRIKDVANQTNPTDMVLAHGQLLSDFTTMKQNALNNARIDAEKSMNVPALQENLLRLQRIDQDNYDKNPNLALGASPATVQAIQLLDNARTSAAKLATDSIQSNITLQSMASKIDTAGSFLTSMSNVAENKLLSKEAKDQADAEKLKDLVAAIPTEVLNRVQLLNPSMDTKDAAAHLMMKKTNAPDEYAALNASNDQLPMLAVLHNNTTAKTLFTMQEAARQGVDQTVIADQVNEFTKMVNNPLLLKQAAIKAFGPKSEEVKSMPMDTKMGSTKEEVAATLANRYNIAAAIRSKNLQTNFENDVSKWNQPALQEATLKVQQLNLPVNMANVAKMYIGDAIGPDKQAKLSAFANYARQAGSKLENSPLGGVNTNSAIQNMANDLISQSLNIASQTIHSTGKGAMRIEAPQGITTQDVMGAGLY